MFPSNHCAHKYSEKAEFLFLRNTVWKYDAVAALSNSNYHGAPCTMWKLVNKLPDTVVGECILHEQILSWIKMRQHSDQLRRSFVYE